MKIAKQDLLDADVRETYIACVTGIVTCSIEIGETFDDVIKRLRRHHPGWFASPEKPQTLNDAIRAHSKRKQK